MKRRLDDIPVAAGEDQEKKEFIDQERVNDANTILSMLTLVLRPHSMEDLKAMLHQMEKAESGAVVFMAFGATPEWLDIVAAKKEALKYLIRIRELIDERVL